MNGVALGSDAEFQGVAEGDVVLRVGPNKVQSPEQLWRAIDGARSEGRRFGLFMLLQKKQPVVTSFHARNGSRCVSPLNSAMARNTCDRRSFAPAIVSGGVNPRLNGAS